MHARSWSWASVKSKGVYWVRGPGIRPRYVEIIECETTPQTSRLPFGQVTSGRIRIRGPLRQIFNSQSTSRSEVEQDRLTASNMSTTGSASSKKGKSKKTLLNLAQKFKFSVEWDVEFKLRDSHFIVSLRVTDIYGLFLIKEKSGVFRRVGFCSAGRKENADKYFAEVEVMEIETI